MFIWVQCELCDAGLAIAVDGLGNAYVNHQVSRLHRIGGLDLRGVVLRGVVLADRLQRLLVVVARHRGELGGRGRPRRLVVLASRLVGRRPLRELPRRDAAQLEGRPAEIQGEIVVVSRRRRREEEEGQGKTDAKEASRPRFHGRRF